VEEAGIKLTTLKLVAALPCDNWMFIQLFIIDINIKMVYKLFLSVF